MRPNDGSGPSRYWLAGLKYLGRKKTDETGAFNRSDPDMALLLGYGWRETYPNGLRVLAEVGPGGGEGFMFFVNVGFQWGSRGAN